MHMILHLSIYISWFLNLPVAILFVQLKYFRTIKTQQEKAREGEKSIANHPGWYLDRNVEALERYCTKIYTHAALWIKGIS